MCPISSVRQDDFLRHILDGSSGVDRHGGSDSMGGSKSLVRKKTNTVRRGYSSVLRAKLPPVLAEQYTTVKQDVEARNLRNAAATDPTARKFRTLSDTSDEIARRKQLTVAVKYAVKREYTSTFKSLQGEAIFYLLFSVAYLIVNCHLFFSWCCFPQMGSPIFSNAQ